MIAREGFILVSEVYYFAWEGLYLILFYFSRMKFLYLENKVQFYFLQVRIFSLFFANKILFWQMLVFMLRNKGFYVLQEKVFIFASEGFPLLLRVLVFANDGFYFSQVMVFIVKKYI